MKRHPGPEPKLECKLGVIQRVLVPYRAPLFNLLAARSSAGVSVFAGNARHGETIQTAKRLETASFNQARNHYLFDGRLELYWQLGLREWLERWQPETLVMEANPRGLSTRVAVRWMHDRGRPVLGWGMGAYSVTPGLARLRDRRRRRFLRMFDGLLAYGSRAAEQYRAAGVPGDRIFICQNAVTSRPASPPPERPPYFRGRPVVLFVGRLTPAKRVDLLLRACGRVATSEPQLAPELQIVGDGEALPSLRALAQEVYPDCAFDGRLHGEAVAARFAAADLFVLPHLGGLAVQEAMSHGLPVVVGDGDGTQEDLVRLENGWRVMSGSVEELAAVIRTALSDPVRLRAMGERSFRIVADEVNLDTLADSFISAVTATCTRSTSKLAPGRDSRL